MTDSLRSRLWRECKPFVGLVVVIVVYAAVRVACAAVAGTRGVLSPSGGVDTTVAAFVLVTFVLRAVVLFVVPLIATYRLVMRVLRTRSGIPPQ